jgi:hypothetical protein
VRHRPGVLPGADPEADFHLCSGATPRSCTARGRSPATTGYSNVYVLGNKGITTAANVLFNCSNSDFETCLTVIPTALHRKLDNREIGFAMEAEITGKLLRRGIGPDEVPISYRARSRGAGKKLTWREGVEAVWILVRERFARRPHRRSQPARELGAA